MSEITPDTAISASFMAREILEIPEAAARLSPGSGAAERVAAELSRRAIPFVVLCGRGSSGHAGVYLRYLIETRLGLPVSASAPSVVTGYERVPRVAGALFVVISQSGRSPDLVAATRAARDGGALTLAIVNDPTSPAARAADLVLPIAAGPEWAVAATKTVVNSFLASAALVAHWAGDRELAEGLGALPARLGEALALDWSAWSADLAAAPAAFVTGRGHGLGTVREIALKLSETLRLPALGYSAAELRHGPRASVSTATPVLALRQADPTAESVDHLARDLRREGLTVHACGGPAGTLPWLPDGHPACDPIVMLVPAYRAIEREARRRGLDPDAPAGLTKVTETL
ncbi:SIS domain-containing protein [Methylobacterium oxalidis]|uniref:Glucosamine--fructose-6-phosphate aminotransferase n=1 Tax=Methylobacterium oxalidis TaxID=944322 RepID=A0A512JBN4_9HYPH|nr:SIS domain-containing protein [Methylobacterium oxalidis]GEP07305.1 glucosamine--fructose-6-phosphate aminotransferase [Methylobacterium oxalidis]GJE31592.1 Glutamine--fructose-6-phosphate aminotransferase [isomerizing] [Methylobacterium oxalidis]GLS64111.1 glucosamine--fructose-6-phosphate aminotransferase [Methylobacterium oxalidis]